MIDCGKPKRIVSLSPSNTEILFTVGAGPNVVGVTDYCNYPDELMEQIKTQKTTMVGGYWDPSVEKIVELKPDLVLVSCIKCTVKTNECKTACSRKCETTTKLAKQLTNLGLNVLTLSPHSLDDVLGEILFVGKNTGNFKQAQTVVDDLKQRISKVVADSKLQTARPKVYFEVWNDPYISVNSKTWIGNLIALAGGTNIFGNKVSEWPIIQSEDVIKQKPDIIVFPVIKDVPRFWESFEAVKKRQGWNTITAVKNDALYELARDCISRPGPRLVDSLEKLAKVINTTS